MKNLLGHNEAQGPRYSWNPLRIWSRCEWNYCCLLLNQFTSACLFRTLSPCHSCRSQQTPSLDKASQYLGRTFSIFLFYYYNRKTWNYSSLIFCRNLGYRHRILLIFLVKRQVRYRWLSRTFDLSEQVMLGTRITKHSILWCCLKMCINSNWDHQVSK